VVNGTGVSKTFQILYRNEEVLLDDIIMFRVHILVDSHKVSYRVFVGYLNWYSKRLQAGQLGFDSQMS
jgi:hypothetical protein